MAYARARSVASPRQTRATEFLLLDDDVLLAQCDVDCYRSRGPGGQKRNKTSTAVRLRHRPTGLSVTATEDRSQRVNKVRSLARLRQAIALQVRNRINAEDYSPSELLASCVSRHGGVSVGRRDRRYLLAVGEVLDVLAACDVRVREAAKRTGVSTAHLVKFIRNDPKLWKTVNQMRAAVRLKALR